MENDHENEKGIVTSKQPNLYVNIVDFLAENGYMGNKSEIIRDAIDRKLQQVCKLQMESDQVFNELHDGMKIVSYHLRQDQIDVIEVLLRLGLYSARSEFIRDAIGDYLIDKHILSDVLEDRAEDLKDKVLKFPITINGENKIIYITKDGNYFES